MAQNTSHAVMAQRIEPHNSLDDFPTPPWATRALMEHVLVGDSCAHETVWEPACNRGYMARPLAEYFDRVIATDIHAYGWTGQRSVCDFLYPGSEPTERVDWVITNPPFRLAKEFVLRGLEVATHGVAILARSVFIEGKDRYESLFTPHQLWAFCPFVERVPMVKGRYDPKASTATSYAWFVWVKDGAEAPQVIQIPPCRKKLEHPADDPR